MITPSFAEVEKLAQDFRLIPLRLEIYADTETPISIFRRLENSSDCFLLESVEGGERWSQYSFIGRKPFLKLIARGKNVELHFRNGKIENRSGNPVEILQELLKDYASPIIADLPRFAGGAVGYFGYDLIRHYEELPDKNPNDLGIPDAQFLFCDEIIAFDHRRQTVQLIVNMQVTQELEASYKAASKRLQEIHAELRDGLSRRSDFHVVLPKVNTVTLPEANVTKEKYCAMVERAKEYIHNGDIFQVVLSQRFEKVTMVSPLDAYRMLRVTNPSPYMFFLKFADYSLVGASPERLLLCDDGLLETYPIAGTRKRGQDEIEDDQLAAELLADEKECAEHRMLVDLGRNDLGRVATIGSVTVPRLMEIERYSHVMHIVSVVRAKLHSNKNSFDALMSVMPAGTLSGAPKIRAMEIIDELEPSRRQSYGGAVAYLGFNGKLDSCITIRTILFKDGKAFVQAGAGIVADSVAATEYEECCNKARALFHALEMSARINEEIGAKK